MNAGKVIDLMAALKASLAAGDAQKQGLAAALDCFHCGAEVSGSAMFIRGSEPVEARGLYRIPCPGCDRVYTVNVVCRQGGKP